jgi:predicted house-cleaning noncanonical NTP pyrophosphatase (MazG superfamily)
MRDPNIDIEAAGNALHRIETLPDDTTDQIYRMLLEFQESRSAEHLARLLESVDVLASDHSTDELKAELVKFQKQLDRAAILTS